MTKLLETGIAGLDLTLGGGVPMVARAPDGSDSATVLIRGGPGAGKSILAATLAKHFAEQLHSDPVFACIEILPTELKAQLEGLGLTGVDTFPWSDPPVTGRHSLAGLLDLGEGGDEEAARAALSHALESLHAAASKAVAPDRGPRVLVLDSLSDGYGLGATAPRVLVDEVCKLGALRGLVLLLIEEAPSLNASPWSFAADVVLHLFDAEPGTPFERRMEVVKNRFGPSVPTAGRFSITRNGFESFPPAVAYMVPWAAETLFPTRPAAPTEQGWGIEWRKGPDALPTFRDSVTLVSGEDSRLVLDVARLVGATANGQVDGGDTWVRLGRMEAKGSDLLDHRPADALAMVGPLISVERLLYVLWRILRDQSQSADPQPRIVRRVLLGDLRAIETLPDPARSLQVVAGAARIARCAGVPIVFYQTASDGVPSRLLDAIDVHLDVALSGKTSISVSAQDIASGARQRADIPRDSP